MWALEIAARFTDLGAPWLDDAEQPADVVAQRLDGGGHLQIGGELDRLPGSAPFVGEGAVGEQSSRDETLLGGVELRVAPRPRADVGPRRNAPELLGQQADLGRVESRARPSGCVGIAAKLTQQVSEAPQITPGIAR